MNKELVLCTSSSCLSGDDSSTCIGILAKEVEIVASSDSSISSKARGSNKVGTRILWCALCGSAPTHAADSCGNHLDKEYTLFSENQC